MIGPRIGATSVVIDQMPSAVARLLAGKMEINSACEPGIIGPRHRALQDAKHDQRVQAPRNAAKERGEGEHQHRRDEGLHHAVAAHQPAGQRHRNAIGDRETRVMTHVP